jgi:hypothetical protein
MFARGINAGITLAVAIQAQTNRLDRFSGRYLWKTHFPKTDRPYLAGLVSEAPKGFQMAPEPWYQRRVNHDSFQ